MKRSLLVVLMLSGLRAGAQLSQEYSGYIKQAEAAYDSKQYKESSLAYSKAFESNGWKGLPEDRYNAACSWAMAGNADSAFGQLERIASKGLYSNLNHIKVDTDLESLHKDKRWDHIIAMVKANKEKEEVNLDKALVAQLDTIMMEDQEGRMKLEALPAPIDFKSDAVQQIVHVQERIDSINVIKVTRILDKYGWLGPDVVGREGNTTLFLVIQHADQKVQEKYLPMMREAVKNRKAQPGSLALLEDRVALGQGKKQVYGSQIGMADGGYYLSPLEDPDNVDKRRAEVGLGPLAEYLQHWNIKWDVAVYKKELPEIERKEKAMRNR